MEQNQPQHQVLNTYELAEAILEYLLPTALRSAKLVCKSWHEIISRSQSLDSICRMRDHYINLALIGESGVGRRSFARGVSGGDVTQYSSIANPQSGRGRTRSR
jgi:hypothetical protein